MTPRLVELVREAQQLIGACNDDATEVVRVCNANKAWHILGTVISRLMAEGGLSKEPLRPLGPEVMQLVIDLREYAEEARTSGNGLADVPNRLLSDAAEMLSITEYGYRKVCEKNDELQALCSALLQASEGCGSSNPVDDGAVERMRKALQLIAGSGAVNHQAVARAALEAAEPHP